MKFFFTVAWRNIWRNARRSLITASAMALSVGLCMAMVAITDGFYDVFYEVMVTRKIGHIQIRHQDYPKTKSLYDTVKGAEHIMADISKLPETVGLTGRLYSSALVEFNKNGAGAQISGIQPETEKSISTIFRQIEQGRYLSAEPKKEAIVGISLWEDLEYEWDDQEKKMLLLTQAADGSTAYDEFEIVGVYKSGSVLFDRGIQVHLQDLQKLLLMEEQVHEILVLSQKEEGIQAHSDAVEEMDSVKNAKNKEKGVVVTTWWEASPQTFEMMAFRDFGAFLFLGIIFFIAGFGILNTMLMSVFERTTELGVLKALGLRPSKMVLLIVVESVLLSGIAAILGLMLGGLLDYYLVTQGLDMSGGTGKPLEMMGTNLDPIMRGAVKLNLLFFVPVVSLFFISVLASLWPAIRAARLNPVEAIRSE